MSHLIKLKQHDTGPELRCQVVNDANEPIPLVGATARFHMWSSRLRSGVIDDEATVVDASTGIVSYEWSPFDTANVGHFEAEFELTLADGTVLTVPNAGYIHVDVMADINLQEPSALIDAVVVLLARNAPTNYVSGDTWENAGTGGVTNDATVGTSNGLYRDVTPELLDATHPAYPGFSIPASTTYPVMLADVGFSVPGDIWQVPVGEERTFAVMTVPMMDVDAGDGQKFAWFYDDLDMPSSDSGWVMENAYANGDWNPPVFVAACYDGTDFFGDADVVPLYQAFHVVVLRFTTSSVAVYVDGERIGGMEIQGWDGIGDVGPLSIGSGQILRGICAWDRALTEGEIRELNWLRNG